MKTKAADYRGILGYRAVFNRNPLLAKELQYRQDMATESYNNDKLNLNVIPENFRKYANKDEKNFAGFYKTSFKGQFYLNDLDQYLTPEYKVKPGFWKTLMDPKNFSSKEEQDRYIQRNLIITNPELQKKAYNLWL